MTFVFFLKYFIRENNAFGDFVAKSLIHKSRLAEAGFVLLSRKSHGLGEDKHPQPECAITQGLLP